VFTGFQSTSSQPSSWFRRYRAVGVSVTAHLALLAWLIIYAPKPIDIAPTWLAYGDSTRTQQVIYFPPSSDDKTVESAKLVLPRETAKKRSQPKPPKAAQKPEPLMADAEAGERDSKAGSALGTMIDGPISGHEVHVAYPTVYPDPPVDRAELPKDLVGDVVIEVTIDSQGNVVETKIVQAIGHGIDEKIEATLRRWHYKPATLDGSPVASHHDVHFHFPS
jgi:TonB family protein